MNQEIRELRAAGGRKIAYRCAEVRETRCLLLLFHGFAEHSGYYTEAMRALAAGGVATFAPDLPGHGHGGGLPGDLRSRRRVLEEAAQVEAEARRRVPGVPVFVFGHSAGGLFALLYALEHQPSLAGLILSAPLAVVPSYVSPLTVRVAALLARVAPRLPLQRFDYHRVSRRPEVIRRLEEDPLYYKGKMRARMGYELLEGMREATAHLGELALPLLLLHGAEDVSVEPESSRVVLERASSRDKTRHLVSEARHHLLLEPEGPEILKLMTEWMVQRLP